ncbi:MAG: carboxypeptidase regulatory-like domain-containing protein [Acidobacteriaceae bacterium]
MKRLLLFTLMMLSASLPAQNGPAPGDYSISGTVVNAITGSPLDRAEVTLATPGENGTDLAEAITTETGAFRFDHLPAGKYALQASRRGYLSASYQEHDPGYFTAIVTGPHLDAQDLRFELTPYGAISGAITDDNGNPVGEAQVTLFRQDQSNGETKIQEAGSDTADDAGGYEFTRLKPGTYYVDVSATPWYSFRPARSADPDGSSDSQPTGPLDVAYPTTFYPNATDSSGATPLTLNGGDRVQANMSLHAVAAIHIEVRVPTSDPRRGVQTPMLEQDVFGSQQYIGMPIPNFSHNQSSMTFDYGSLAPGHYVLQQGGQDVALDANVSRVVDAPSAGGPAAGVAVTGKFAMASGAPLPEFVVAWLHPTDGATGRRIAARVERDGHFSFANITPGTYDVKLTGDPTSPVVVQMAASGAEVHGNRITVGSDSVLLAATLASGSTTVNGFARRDGKVVGGLLILMVPNDPNASEDLVRLDQSDSDGSFTLQQVVPGNYTIVAIENGWGLEWSKPDVIARYRAHGLKVLVPENQRTLALQEAVDVQPR